MPWTVITRALLEDCRHSCCSKHQVHAWAGEACTNAVSGNIDPYNGDAKRFLRGHMWQTRVVEADIVDAASI